MVLDVAGAVLLALGLLLATIGLYGLLRMPDIFHQLHPAGLVTGPAVILVLLASIATDSAEIITSAALVILFVLVTSPLSTHAIAQAASRRPRRPRDQEPLRAMADAERRKTL
jgi:multicomponent Na+:H+ antiporter subunit G